MQGNWNTIIERLDGTRFHCLPEHGRSPPAKGDVIERTTPKGEIVRAEVTRVTRNKPQEGSKGLGTVAIMALAGARLLNAFAVQVETMRRLRSGGAQIIRIERVEVSDGGQAVIGNVRATSPTRDG